ncbi:MAG: hypothetical protein C4516_08895 [Oxalobacter sp.]|nr:MAG: hypothetical protein C4516_08895 [Oxalobacter sp.]
MPASSEALLKETFTRMSTEKLRRRAVDPELTPLARELAQAELNLRLNPEPLPMDHPETQERLEDLYANMSTSKLSARAQDATITPFARKLARDELAWRLNQATPEYAERKNQKVEETMRENDAKRSLLAWLVGGVALFVLGMAVFSTVFDTPTLFQMAIYALCFVFVLAMIFGKLFPRTSRTLAILMPLFVLSLAGYYWKRVHEFPLILLIIILPPFSMYAAYRMYKASLDERPYAEFLTEMEEIARSYREKE